MEKKLICFDIDGTILGKKGMLESTRRAIQGARANGHCCVVNTGRTRKLVGPELRGLTEFDGYLMGCGTELEYRGERIFHKTLPAEASAAVIASLRRHRIDAILEGAENNFNETPDRIYSERFRQVVLHFQPYGYGDFEAAVGNYDKLTSWPAEPAEWARFAAEFSGVFDFIDREEGMFEAVPKGFSKAGAMEQLAGILGIPAENTVAIGDSTNDLSMLRGAHTAIVMGNAPAELRRIADFVTADVDEDGIENALRWLGVL